MLAKLKDGKSKVKEKVETDEKDEKNEKDEVFKETKSDMKTTQPGLKTQTEYEDKDRKNEKGAVKKEMGKDSNMEKVEGNEPRDHLIGLKTARKIKNLGDKTVDPIVTQPKVETSSSVSDLQDDKAVIMMLRAQLEQLTKQFELLGSFSNASGARTQTINAMALVSHKQSQKAEIDDYVKLQNIVANEGPKMTTTERVPTKLTPFKSPLTIKTLNDIPTLFSIETIGTRDSKVNRTTVDDPHYLVASAEAFGPGVMESHFVFKSKNFPKEISFTPMGSPKSLSNVLEDGKGPVKPSQNKYTYVLNIVETMFSIFKNTQFILTNVSPRTFLASGTYSGDQVTQLHMLRSKFIDQSFPLLPAGPYDNYIQYVRDAITAMFENPDHRMTLGEIQTNVQNQVQISADFAVVTDQFTAALNENYWNYLQARSPNQEAYRRQHETLTLPGSSITLAHQAVFALSICPIWQRDESDGSLLLYALDVNRQSKYLDYLIDLLKSTNLVTFASTDQIVAFEPRAAIRDPIIIQTLDRMLQVSNETHFFEALACDLSATWVDCVLESRSYYNDPVSHLFRIWTILLWFIFFPSIARDNAPDLMYQLMTSMKYLVPDTAAYLNQHGFTNISTDPNTVRLWQKRDYLAGDFEYIFLTHRPPANKPILREMHDIIHDRNGAAVIDSRDDATTIVPRMSNVRRIYQPCEHLLANLQGFEKGETANHVGNLIERISRVIDSIITAYINSNRGRTAAGTFGTSRAPPAELTAMLNAFINQKDGLGMRYHAEVYALRSLAIDSIYLVDSQHFGPDKRLNRPQMAVEVKPGNWSTLPMVRASRTIPFELPLYMLFALRGCDSLAAISPPDAHIQLQQLNRIQEEGIMCGDVMHLVNSIKHGSVGMFSREMFGISNLITSTRAELLLQRLASLSDFDDYKDLFQILVNQVARHVDSRAINFKIIMQPYDSRQYIPNIPQPTDSLYDQNLRLGRSLLTESLRIMSPLFVPETSPVALYTTGLFLSYQIVHELDPFAFFDLSAIISEYERIVMWSPNLVGFRGVVGQLHLQEMVLNLPAPNGTIEQFQFGADVPKTLLIVTARTGPIILRNYEFLLQFFERQQISFLFPELMVVLNREVMLPTAREEIDLLPQFKEVLTGEPNRRVHITFGDTVVKPRVISESVSKRKYMFPISEIDKREIILRGVNDPVQQTRDFYIGSWMSWAYGEPGGKYLTIGTNEVSNAQASSSTSTAAEPKRIDKLNLGLVNMNNNLRILRDPAYIQLPDIDQDNTGVVGGIYNV